MLQDKGLKSWDRHWTPTRVGNPRGLRREAVRRKWEDSQDIPAPGASPEEPPSQGGIKDLGTWTKP